MVGKVLPRSTLNSQAGAGFLNSPCMAGASAPKTWELRRAGYSLRAPPELRLPRSDPLAFLEQHRERLGAHARAVHGLAPQVRCRL